MKTNWRRHAATAALALGLLVVGCDSAGDPAGPPMDAPTEIDAGLLDDILGRGDNDLSLVRNTLGFIRRQVVSGVVGPEGAKLSLLGHELVVAPGSVAQPTLFVMVVLPGRTIQVELLALDLRTGLNIGERGFDIPVQLALSYRWADVEDPQDLTIVHILRDGRRIPIESTVDEEARLVRADLDHFSRYGLCSN